MNATPDKAVLVRQPSVSMLVASVVCALVLAAAFAFAFTPAADAYAASTTTMYRTYNPNSGEHFYTANVAERNNLKAAGWRLEGVGWIAPATSNTPVYRLYSGTDHHYTMSAQERDSLVKVGWRYEGIGWYSDDSKQVPLYRQFNPNVNPKAARNNSGSHNYTTSKGENDSLVRVGWRGEGVGWYGVPEAYALLDYVNSARAAKGIRPLTWNSSLYGPAQVRAQEISRVFSHTRPNGTACFTAWSNISYSTSGENIASGQTDVESANQSWTNSPGHYGNMINANFTQMAAACYEVNGTKYWVECFIG